MLQFNSLAEVERFHVQRREQGQALVGTVRHRGGSIYLVGASHGGSYTVDVEQRNCNCHDWERANEGVEPEDRARCKHLWAAELASSAVSERRAS